MEAAARRCPDLNTADNKLTDGTGVIAVQEICDNQVVPGRVHRGRSQIDPGAGPVRGDRRKPFEARALRSALGHALVLVREHRAAGMIG